MDFMGRYSQQEDDDEHHQQQQQQQMNLVSGTMMLPLSSPNSASSSSSPSSSSSTAPHYHRGPVPLASGDSRLWDSRVNYHNQQQQQLPWAWPEKRSEDDVEEEEITGTGVAAGAVVSSAESEHMFNKVVTPSDVGKLNRLVIPKQHAEKFFPLDSSTHEQGLLLNFEDRSGKPWRFRYSYWNSSQSYVMTKGWSRFVKEKRLDAGDIVSFHRGVGEAAKDRLYIDYRRRPHAPPPPDHASATIAAGSFLSSISPHHHLGPFRRPSSQLPWTNPLLWRPPPTPPPPATVPLWDQNYNQILGHHQYHHRNTSYGSGPYGPPVYHPFRSGGSHTSTPQQEVQEEAAVQHEGEGEQQVEPMVFESIPVVHGKPAALVSTPKTRLRLFGVNMECPIPQSAAAIPYSTSILAPQVPLNTNSIASASTSQYHPLHLSLYHSGTPLLDKPKGSASSSSLDFEMLN